MNKDEQKYVVLQATLMTDDHIFIDSANNIIYGKEKSLEAWRGFFELFPIIETSLKTLSSEMILL